MINKNKFIVTYLMLLLATVTFAKQVRAQSDDLKMTLQAVQFKLNRLAANQLTDEAIFAVDQPGLVLIETITSRQDIQISVVTPSGRIITPANAAMFGGEFFLTNAAAGNSPSIFPSLTGNFHYIYSIPSQESGNYTVRFQAPAGLAQEVPLITEITWDSPVVAKLFATENLVVVGNPVVLSAAVFNGTQPVTGATVEVVIKDAAGGKTTINLLDNGSQADDAAGDGLYSGEFTPSAPGRYSIVAGITGSIAGGASFVRHSLTEITAIAAGSKLNGTAAEQSRDDNFDGLIDRVSFSVGTQTTIAGSYQAFVHLKTANAKEIVGSGTANLVAGSGQINVDINAETFREVGENGPYTIEKIVLDVLDPNFGSQTIDRNFDFGLTQAYTIGQFQRKPLILTGQISEQGVDDNGNGQFDRLVVSVQVDVLTPGFYRWNMKLSDQNSNRIDFANGQGFLTAGLNQIPVTFNGSTIGLTGQHGPFLVNDLLLFGPKSLVAAEAGRTRPYRSANFENGVPDDTTPPDLQVTLSPDSLWPPNHSMRPVTATITVTDDFDPNPQVILLSIESNEPDSGTGGGDQPNDIQEAAAGTDDRSFSLRAERLGSGNGRIYTVKYQARDAAGNTIVVTKQVVVPHDQGNN